MSKRIKVIYAAGARDLAEKLFSENDAESKLLSAIFGSRLPEEAICLATGALDGATVSFEVLTERLIANINHPFVEVQQRWFFKDTSGDLVARNYTIKKSRLAPERFGITMFHSQVEAARKLRFKRILVSAAGSPRPGDYNGYYTWARFGFDAELDEYAREELPLHLAQARSLNELMQLGGYAWWKANGWATEMIFDLREGSDSMRVLDAYVAELRQQGQL